MVQDYAVQGEANAATDPTIKELKQLVDSGRQQGRRGLVAGTEGVL